MLFQCQFFFFYSVSILTEILIILYLNLKHEEVRLNFDNRKCNMNKQIRRENSDSFNKFLVLTYTSMLNQSIVIDLQNLVPQIQGSIQQIIKHKALNAFDIVRNNVFVEDTSLAFNAYCGMPGPYVKWFIKAVGSNGLYKMVEHSQDKTAFAICTIGFMNRHLKEPKIFVGQVSGRIVKPRGDNGFGWDPIFEPEGGMKTYAEMGKDKNKISHRKKAIMELKEYLENIANTDKLV